MGRPRKRRARWWLRPAELMEPSSPAHRKMRARWLQLAESLPVKNWIDLAQEGNESQTLDEQELRERWVAEQERNWAKRSVSIKGGLASAKDAGKRLGRRAKLSEAQQAEARRLLASDDRKPRRRTV